MALSTLTRIEENDPVLTRLSLTRDDDGEGEFWPADGDELSRLGVAIGENDHLRSLMFNFSVLRELPNWIVTNRAFLSGIERNASIDELSLGHCDLSEAMGREVLNELVAKIGNLSEVELYRCPLGNGGAGALASALAACETLRRVYITYCIARDGDVEEIISGIDGMRQLGVLRLKGNSIGTAGCEALAALIRDPGCSLGYADLRSNGFDDDCVGILANSLMRNEKLEILDLGVNAITERGWRAFSKVLCDASSVNDTYLSNHTLRELRGSNRWGNLLPLLELNHAADKKQIAVQKILSCHPRLDMEPFLEWDLKVLPTAVDWFDRAIRCVVNGDGGDVNARKLSAIYQFARAEPLMFVPPSKAGAKREKGGDG